MKNIFCTSCGNKISDDIKFCGECGKKAGDSTVTEPYQKPVSVPINTDTKIQDNKQTLCQICGTRAPVKYNEFYANIGMLVARRRMYVKANMCRSCTDKYFWKYTGTNLFLGWWGAISFFSTCFYMINNIFRYLGSLSLKKQ